MEIFNKLPFELQGMVLSHSYLLCDATPDQLEVFHNLPPEVQQKVYNDAFSSAEVRDSRNHRCNPRSGRCVLRFCLYGFFNMPEAAEEYPHHRQHGMCSQCKEKNERRLARRKERLEGIARLNQAIRDDDEQGMDAYGHWCAVESDYDELSEHAPNEH